MAFQGNIFSILGGDGDDDDDVLQIIARVAARKVESKSLVAEKKNSSKETDDQQQKPSSRHVERKNGRGRVGGGHNSGRRNADPAAEQNDGWEYVQRHKDRSSGYRRYNSRPDNNQHENGHVSGYWMEKSQGNGNGQRYDNQQSGGSIGHMESGNGSLAQEHGDHKGDERKGSGRGRGNWYSGENYRERRRGFNVDNGFENKNQADQQKQELDGSQEKLIRSNFNDDDEQSKDGSSESAVQRSGNGGDYRESDTFVGSSSDDHGNTAGVEGNAPETVEASKGAELIKQSSEKHSENKQQSSENHSEKKLVYKKLLTLEEYEKKQTERRKTLEALKAEERKVTLDKDFESMKLVDKRMTSVDVYIKLSANKEKLKKNENTDKDVKKHKPVSISLKPAEGQHHRRHGDRGQYNGGHRGGYSRPTRPQVEYEESSPNKTEASNSIMTDASNSRSTRIGGQNSNGDNSGRYKTDQLEGDARKFNNGRQRIDRYRGGYSRGFAEVEEAAAAANASVTVPAEAAPKIGDSSQFPALRVLKKE